MKFKEMILAAGLAVFALPGVASAITVTAGAVASDFNITGGTVTGSGATAQLHAGGLLFDPANLTGGSGDGNCKFLGGQCIQLNTNATTTVTTDPAGGTFNLTSLAFVLDGTPSELSIWNIEISDSTLVVTADVAGGSCTASSTRFCVLKNDWYTMNFEGALNGVTQVLFDNSGTGNIRIGALAATVPVPAAGFMLLGALGGLAALRRRRKAATAA